MSSCRWKPTVTPWIMLATSVRESPCSWRARRESLGRSTRTCPASTVTFISRSSFCATLPLGPSTFTSPGCADTLTLSGILIGRLPIKIPDKVKVSAQPGLVNVEGPKGKVAQKLDREMKVTVEAGQVRVDRPNDSRRARQLHGLSRTLVANMIHGVTVGFQRQLDIAGVGYKAELKGKEIVLALGFSHPVIYPLPEGVSAEYDAKANRITVKGADKHQIGLVAAEIRKLRPPEPYKGKGVKYAEETIRRKQGKTGAA